MLFYEGTCETDQEGGGGHIFCKYFQRVMQILLSAISLTICSASLY